MGFTRVGSTSLAPGATLAVGLGAGGVQALAQEPPPPPAATATVDPDDGPAEVEAGGTLKVKGSYSSSGATIAAGTLHIVGTCGLPPSDKGQRQVSSQVSMPPVPTGSGGGSGTRPRGRRCPATPRAAMLS